MHSIIFRCSATLCDRSLPSCLPGLSLKIQKHLSLAAVVCMRAFCAYTFSIQYIWLCVCELVLLYRLFLWFGLFLFYGFCRVFCFIHRAIVVGASLVFFFCFYSLVRLVSLFGSTTIFRLYEPLYVECGSSLCRASTILFLSHKHTSGGYTRTASNIQRNQCQYIKSRQTCRFHTHFVPSLGPMWFASVVWDGQTVLAKSFFSW